MGDFQKVDHDLWRRCISNDQRIRQNTYAVAMAFSMFGDYTDGTDVFPSMATIAEMVGLSNATKVHPHRRKLVEHGYLADTGARSAADTVVYRLTAPADVVAAAQGGRGPRDRRKPPKAYEEAAASSTEPTPPDRGVRPSGGRSGPVNLTLDQKTWFLGKNSPEAWPWPDVPYAEAANAYRLYSGQIAA
ncbi:hypothetical protein ACIGW0_12165 [Streptomyces bikiniensis]|uniref:Helix-turn-helix domain-containing protein n=1 Tax=Streptomyces bikiniensis TaxID=1896 RepID=A0ABW8CRD6_STRBI